VSQDEQDEAAEQDSGLARDASLGELRPRWDDGFVVPVMGGPTAGSVCVGHGERVGRDREGTGRAEQDVNEQSHEQDQQHRKSAATAVRIHTVKVTLLSVRLIARRVMSPVWVAT